VTANAAHRLNTICWSKHGLSLNVQDAKRPIEVRAMEGSELRFVIIDSGSEMQDWESFITWWAMTIAMSFGIPPKYFNRVVPKDNLDYWNLDCWRVAERINLTVGLMHWRRPAIVLVIIILLLVMAGVR
jgi:hypothetical protein